MDAYRRYLMRAPLLMFALAAVLFGLPSLVGAQTVGMYPYSAFETKPLALGSQVWANFGGNECAYPRMSNYPLAEDRCFEGHYRKARIQGVFVAYREGIKQYYAYRVGFEFAGNGRGRMATRAAFLDDAFTIYNLPQRWAEWSRNFVLLSW